MIKNLTQLFNFRNSKINKQISISENLQLGILLGGQSNMQGNTERLPPRYLKKPIPGIKISNNQSWEYLEFGKNQKSYKSYTFGPELSLGHELSKRIDTEVLFAKHAVSSAPLYDDPERLNFNIFSEKSQFPHLLYEGKKLINQIKENKKVPVIIFIWIQGEGDAADDFGSSNYFNHFTEIYNKLQEDGVEIDYTILNRLKIGKRWRDNPDVLGRYKQIQKQQQDWVKLNDNSVIIDMEPFPFGKDELHFSAKGQIEIGKGLSRIITNKIIPKIK